MLRIVGGTMSLLLAGVLAAAQDTASVVEPPRQADAASPQVEAQPADDSTTSRDPTQVDPALQPLLGVGQGPRQPLVPPTVVVRGRALAAKGQAVALLEIAGKLHVVKPGMRISLPGAGSMQTLVIQEITSRHIRIELGDTGQMFNVR